ncbi:MAG: signal peptidase I [Bifidobacteriaceae bacterium]|jgi:signal peptidase I|nr:signal peptidase I [Bifidobacteriaceae bacterium]
MSLTGGAQHCAVVVGKRDASPASSAGRTLAEFGFLVLLVIVLSFVLKTFLIQSFYIPSESMEPLLEENNRVIVTKLAPNVLNLHRGDVVVFHDPGQWGTSAGELPEDEGVKAFFHGVAQSLGLAPQSSEEFLIKRVIGLPGDHITCAGNGAPLVINGVAITEPYIAAGSNPSTQVLDLVVPEGGLWVMGDNRDASADSRWHDDPGEAGYSEEWKGAVPIDNVVGVAQLRSWPLDRFALIKNPGSVFAQVPDPSPAG